MGSVITAVRLSLRVQRGMWWRDLLPCGSLTSGPYRNTDTHGDGHTEKANSQGIVFLSLSLVFSLRQLFFMFWLEWVYRYTLIYFASEQFQSEIVVGLIWVLVTIGQRGLSLKNTKLLAFELAKDGRVQHLEYIFRSFTRLVAQKLLIKM